MKARVPWMGVLFLALLAPLMWPPSTTAQQLRHTRAPVNLGPTLNLLFVDIHPASSSSAELPLALGSRRGRPYADVKFLPGGTGKLTYEPFAAPDGTGPANAALLRNAGATRPRSLTPLADHRFQVAHLPPAESEHSQRLPALYQEDTPFATQVRMPLADLWGGRLQFDGFYREISADSVIRGVPQSSGVWRATPGSLAQRSATSYGLRLSFRMPHIQTRTLCRCFVGGRR